MHPIRILALLAAILGCCSTTLRSQTVPSQKPSANAPVVTKVEPPSWWVNLTPYVMLLLSGHNLEATQVSCNLQSIVVERTEATAAGDYFFVWLKFGTGPP